MSDNPPDYELADRLALTSASQVRAIGHPLRTTILQLLHERAATVSELAQALDRPKSTVAHHVGVLGREGLLQVVRTRRVRAVEERFYGRTARLFFVTAGAAAGAARGDPGGSRDDGGVAPVRDFNDFEVAAAESGEAFERGELWGFIRHARISRDQAQEFWQRMAALVEEFDRLPRSGESMYGFAVGVYPTDHPVLPRPEAPSSSSSSPPSTPTDDPAGAGAPATRLTRTDH